MEAIFRMEPEQGVALRLQGTVDDEACLSVRRELAPRLAAGARHVVLDLGDVTHLAPPAIRMLRSLDQHLAGGLLLVRANEHATSQLRVHELDHLLQLQDLKHQEAPAAGPVNRKEPDLTNIVPLVRRA